jgi:3'(2'), 5'-bisphosphate nucleotidase
MTISINELIPEIKEIITAAGKGTLEIYQANRPVEVKSKSDDSPVTQADLISHNIIEQRLTSLPVNYPILSEEGGLESYDERKKWKTYWLIDPLDGTKEFINKNGEFTVNIALIENGEAILGFVYVPVKDILYWGGINIGAYKEDSNGQTRLSVAKVDTAKTLNVVGSRRHGAEELDAILDGFKQVFVDIDLINMGSSLKICAIAEGSAHWYPRLALTSEWDTAAAHAILTAAGGSIFDTELNALSYNQKENILNPFFHAVGDSSFDWKGVIKQVVG